MDFPPTWGVNFTSTIHTKPAGPTDPKSCPALSKPFVAMITGAGKGLGKHIALNFARAGATGLSISSRTRADLESLTTELKEINPDLEVLARTCDTTNEDDIERLASETKMTFDRLDVAVANAGIISAYLTDDDGSNARLPSGITEDEDFTRVIQTNVTGSYLTAKHFVPLLAETHTGPQSFVVVTSMASHFVDSEWTPVAYNLSKIANNRMVEHVHNDHFEKKGVVAFAVHPGAVLTPQTENHRTTQRGEEWDALLGDDIDLCGGFLTWLTREKREWLSGRYVSATWDVEELEKQKDEIVKEDKLKFRMAI